MRITFDLLGRCKTTRTACVYLDKDFTKAPCRGCERNPRLKELTDRFVTEISIAKKLDSALDLAEESLEEIAGEDSPDRVLDEQNDRAGAEFGLRPIAERRAAREAAKKAKKDGLPRGPNRPKIA
jgi:hypothetical protein